MLNGGEGAAKLAHRMATIAVLGTMDSKGEEHGFVAEQIRQRGHQVLVIDTGTLEAPKLKPDITREQVAVGSLAKVERELVLKAAIAPQTWRQSF